MKTWTGVFTMKKYVVLELSKSLCLALGIVLLCLIPRLSRFGLLEQNIIILGGL